MNVRSNTIYFAVMLSGLLALVATAQERANGPTVTRDIQYATRADSPPRLTQLDVYSPGGDGPHPVLVFIHGGSWVFGDKRQIGGKADAFVAAGYVFVSINYRLSPAVQHPAHAQDCGAAVAWVHENIANYGGDPKRIYVMGHSAGAHLAALVSTDESYLKAGGCSLGAIRGTIVLDGGGYDIPSMVNGGEPLARGRYQRAFGKDEAVWRNASPISHVAKDKQIPPFLLVHAGERVASLRQADGLGAKLREAGVKAELFHAENKNHMTLNKDIGATEDATTRAILAFLEANGAKTPGAK
ncbi:MAG: alpha/beta hydrolase [Candidatus Hydrogenedentes bacterium]|nr:alpha/beta hydrolase [Candidatus Hydrogenedentota bacterium]